MNNLWGITPWVFAAAVFLCSCHSKEPCVDCDDTDDFIVPPAGFAFSVPEGELSVYDRQTQSIVRTFQLGNLWAGDAVINQQSTRLFIANQADYHIEVYDLPQVDLDHYAVLPSMPIDIEIDPSGGNVFVLVRNGGFWRYVVTDHSFDTTDVPVQSRAFSLRPPEYREAWVVSPVDRSIRIIDLAVFDETAALAVGATPVAIDMRSDGALAYIATYGSANEISVWSTVTRSKVDSLPSPSGVRDVELSDDGRVLVAADSATGVVRVWHLERGWTQDIDTGLHAQSVCFHRGGRDFAVLNPEENRALHLSVSDTAVAVVDTIMLPERPTVLVLWETPF